MEKENKEQIGKLDTSCTSGVGAKHDADCFHNTGLPSKKVFMLPDKTRIRATKKMRFKHKLRPKASEMNIIPNLHLMLSSIPKMADADYIAVFDKKRPEYKTLQLPLYQHRKTPFLLDHAARTPDCENLTWTMNS
jgi:hypothetical protein